MKPHRAIDKSDNDNASVCEQLVIFEAAFDFALHCQIRLGEFCFTCTMSVYSASSMRHLVFLEAGHRGSG